MKFKCSELGEVVVLCSGTFIVSPKSIALSPDTVFEILVHKIMSILRHLILQEHFARH